MPLNLSLDTSAEMLATVGTPGFGAALMRTGREMLDADYCSLFAFGTEDAPVCLASNGITSNYLALVAAEKYTHQHWRNDPLLTCRPRLRRADTLFFPGIGDNVRSAHHYRECFDLLRIGDRITFLYGDNELFLRLSFYRFVDRPTFMNGEIDTAHRAQAFFRTATARHYGLISTSGSHALRCIPDRASMRERLRTLNAALSPREIEVCAMILQGITAEGISIEIGVSKTSVVTYRKRAYAKLGIATRNELFAACLNLN
jgi:DNA-binding CsgD family transcriptional regulator